MAPGSAAETRPPWTANAGSEALAAVIGEMAVVVAVDMRGQALQAAVPPRRWDQGPAPQHRILRRPEFWRRAQVDLWRFQRGGPECVQRSARRPGQSVLRRAGKMRPGTVAGGWLEPKRCRALLQGCRRSTEHRRVRASSHSSYQRACSLPVSVMCDLTDVLASRFCGHTAINLSRPSRTAHKTWR